MIFALLLVIAVLAILVAYRVDRAVHLRDERAFLRWLLILVVLLVAEIGGAVFA